MKDAARTGDPTKHGSALGPAPGSHNVFIGGKPAWRARVDVHTCPVSEGNKAHVGGVVSGGSSRIFINNSPAARNGDSIIEPSASENNSITMGYDKVQIGD